MKRIYLILSICVLTIGACTNIEDDIVPQQTPMTRGIVNANNSSITNPTLLTDWENLTTVVLNSSTPTDIKRATLPWCSGATTLIPSSIKNDIKKEDGWVMLFHTFKNYGEDEKSNYIVLYNQFRSLLKVLYYLNEIPYPNNNFIWSMQTDNSSNSSIFDSLFPLSASNTAATNNNIVVTNLSDTPSYGLNHGWNAFTIEVPYYSTEYRSLTYKIHGYNKLISDFSFIGKNEQTIKGTSITKVPDSSSSSSQSKPDSKATLNGTEAENGIKNFITNPNIQVGEILKHAIENAPNTGYVEAINAGLKYRGNVSAFGCRKAITRSTTETTEASYTTLGNITLSGSGSSTVTSSVASLSGISLYNEQLGDLGVWSLASTPIIYYERYSNITRTAGQTDPTYIANGKVYTPQKRLTVNVKINPTLEKYIIEKNIDTQIVSCDSINGEKYIRPYFSKIVQSQVLYSDAHIKLCENSNYHSIIINKPTQANMRPLYDWGYINQDNDLALVTVKLVFNYNGKITETISSKLYKPTYIQDGDYQLQLGGGKYYIVDRYQAPAL